MDFKILYLSLFLFLFFIYRFEFLEEEGKCVILGIVFKRFQILDTFVYLRFLEKIIKIL